MVILCHLAGGHASGKTYNINKLIEYSFSRDVKVLDLDILYYKYQDDKDMEKNVYKEIKNIEKSKINYVLGGIPRLKEGDNSTLPFFNCEFKFFINIYISDQLKNLKKRSGKKLSENAERQFKKEQTEIKNFYNDKGYIMTHPLMIFNYLKGAIDFPEFKFKPEDFVNAYLPIISKTLGKNKALGKIGGVGYIRKNESLPEDYEFLIAFSSPKNKKFLRFYIGEEDHKLKIFKGHIDKKNVGKKIKSYEDEKYIIGWKKYSELKPLNDLKKKYKLVGDSLDLFYWTNDRRPKNVLKIGGTATPPQSDSAINKFLYITTTIDQIKNPFVDFGAFVVKPDLTFKFETH